jgi:hypothetical protein
MKNEIRYTLYVLGLGASLVAYAHSQFATKTRVERIEDAVKRVDERVYEIWKEVVKR